MRKGTIFDEVVHPVSGYEYYRDSIQLFLTIFVRKGTIFDEVVNQVSGYEYYRDSIYCNVVGE